MAQSLQGDRCSHSTGLLQEVEQETQEVLRVVLLSDGFYDLPLQVACFPFLISLPIISCPSCNVPAQCSFSRAASLTLVLSYSAQWDASRIGVRREKVEKTF